MKTVDDDLRDLERRAKLGEPGAREAFRAARERAGLPGLAVLSCIHGNLEALEAVLADIDRLGIPDIVCLGDLTGYGPDPVECTDLVRERCRITLLGNHDEVLDKGAEAFPAFAKQVLEWTRGLLRPGWLASRRDEERWRFLMDLPLRHEEGGRLFVHGSPLDETCDFLLPHDFGIGVTERTTKLLGSFEKLLFIGHTHIPGLSTDEPAYRTIDELGGRWSYPGHGKAIINVGSVGQPRDRDPRACYVAVTGDSFEWRRVPYAFEVTREKIVRAGLPVRCGDRLREGV